MCRKRPFATHRQGRLPARAAGCRIPCLILCLADVERVGQCRAPNAPYGLHGRMALVIDIQAIRTEITDVMEDVMEDGWYLW